MELGGNDHEGIGTELPSAFHGSSGRMGLSRSVCTPLLVPRTASIPPTITPTVRPALKKVDLPLRTDGLRSDEF